MLLCLETDYCVVWLFLASLPVLVHVHVHVNARVNDVHPIGIGSTRDCMEKVTLFLCFRMYH